MSKPTPEERGRLRKHGKLAEEVREFYRRKRKLDKVKVITAHRRIRRSYT